MNVELVIIVIMENCRSDKKCIFKLSYNKRRLL